MRSRTQSSRTTLRWALVVACSLAVFSAVTPAFAVNVSFADANLEAAVRTALAKPVGVITDADMDNLGTLSATSKSIAQLGGLEYAHNLTKLDLSGNWITSAAPLAGLTNLTSLDLGFNQIGDAAPFAGLTKLTDLGLNNNQITDVKPLASLTNLADLHLGQNLIVDITPLSGLTNLTGLYLYSNRIASISPLMWMTKLVVVNLIDNQITNITPVTALTKLSTLHLQYNYLDLTPGSGAMTTIATVKGYGANVTYEPQGTIVYRFYNKKNGTHFYTASDTEKNSVLAKLSKVYKLDGEAYRVNAENAANSAPLYRFYNKKKGFHFYTASAVERDKVMNTMSATYTFEGPAYNVCVTPPNHSTTVYRFYNKRTGSHFYTASVAEKDNVVKTLSKTYSLDGPAFYLAP